MRARRACRVAYVLLHVVCVVFLSKVFVLLNMVLYHKTIFEKISCANCPRNQVDLVLSFPPLPLPPPSLSSPSLLTGLKIPLNEGTTPIVHAAIQHNTLPNRR